MIYLLKNIIIIMINVCVVEYFDSILLRIIITSLDQQLESL